MTQNPPPITDDDLHAYVDGVLGPEREAIVAAYLAQHPGQNRRIENWRRQRDQLRAGLAGIVEQPLPPELTMAHLASASRQRRFARITDHARAAALVLLAFGIGASSGWFGRADLGVHREPAATGIAALKLETRAAYRIFAPITPTRATAPDLAAAVGHDFSPPDLTASGYTVGRIEWLATLHGPAAVVMYRAPDARPLLLLVRRMDVPAHSDRMTEDRRNGHTMFTWISHGVGFSVAAEVEPARLHRIANRIRADQHAL